MKDRTILALKGLAIIGVAYYHIASRRIDPELISWANYIIIAFRWCVLGFFLVSGYLQGLSDSKKHRTFLEFTRARVWRLLVPFVLFVLFYSCCWQLVQAIHLPNLAVNIPPDFIGKITSGLWPVDSQVAEQLYFFLLLFGISISLIIVQKLLGPYGMWAATVLAGAAGLIYFPSKFTGFNWGVFIWGIAFYAGGYLLFHYRTKKSAVRIALLVTTVILIGGSGTFGLSRCIPLWLLTEGTTLRLDRASLLVSLGDASGTIYVYHTPFLIRSLVIVTLLLVHGKVLQFIGLNLDVFMAIGLCWLLFESLKNTRAKVILM